MIEHKMKKTVLALHVLKRMMEHYCRIPEVVNRFGFLNASILPVTPDIIQDATATITHELPTTIHMDPTELIIITLEKEVFRKKMGTKKMLNLDKKIFS